MATRRIEGRLGAWDSRRRQFRLAAGEIVQTEQRAPVPIVHGRTRLNGSDIYPIWGRQAEKLTRRVRVGKKGHIEQQVGWLYHGNFARALCVGPVDVVHEIRRGDDVIFEGPVNRSTADANGMTEIDTTIGVLRFYWGLDDQQPDSVLAGTFEAVSGIPGICYYVADFVEWGQGNANPPELLVDLERQLDVLAISDHAEQGDVNPLESLYALLRDDFAGGGLPAADLDAASFEAAAEALITEGIWASPEIDDRHSVRDIIGQYNLLAGGRLIERNGLIAYVLDRPAATVADIGEAELLEEPTVADRTAPANHVNLEYRNRTRNDEEAVEGFIDIAQEELAGRRIEETVNMHWVRQPQVARLLVARLGTVASRGAVEFRRLRLRPSAGEDLEPGDRIRLQYPRWNYDQVLVIGRVARRLNEVLVDAEEDVAVDTSTLAAIDPPETEFVPVHEELTPPVFRFIGVPSEWGGGSLEHARVFVSNQPTTAVNRVRFWLAGFFKDYNLGNQTVHPAYVTVQWVKRAPAEYQEAVADVPAGETFFEDPTIWVLRVKADAPVDRQRLSGLLGAIVDGESGEEIFVLSQRFRDGSAEHYPLLSRLEAVYVEPVAVGVWDVSCVTGVDQPDPITLERDGVDEVVLGTEAFIGPREAFTVNRQTFVTFLWLNWRARAHAAHDSIDAPTGTRYHHDNGILEPDWGTPVGSVYPLGNAELGAEYESGSGDPDVIAGMDEALGAIYDGTETTDDLFYADVDRALGTYYETDFYNPN